MGVLHSLGIWQKGRAIEKEAVLRGPDKVKTFVWQLQGSVEVGVIRKVDAPDARAGRFLDFRVEEKPFSQVVGAVKRHNTIVRKKLKQGGV